MKKLIYFLIFIPGCVLCQSWQWDTVVNTPSKIRFCEEQSGNFYTYEYRSNVISKFDKQRNLLWQKYYAELHIYKISCNSNNQLFITGEFENIVRLQDNFILESRGKSDVFYANLDPNSGKILFINTISSPEADYAGDISCERELIVSCTTGDDTYIAGSVFPKGKNQDIVIARFSLDYVFVDCRMSSIAENAGNDEAAYSIEHEVDESGNIWLLAGINGTINFGGKTYRDTEATYLFKLSRELNVVLYQRIENDAYSEVNNLCVDGSGSVYCVKNYLYEFGAASTILAINTGDGAIAHEYTPNITCNLHKLIATNEGHVLFTGMRIRWAFTGDDAQQYYLVTGELTHEMKVLWLKQDSSLNYISGTDLFVTNDDYLMVSGTFSETLHLAGDHQAPAFNQFLALLKFPHDSLLESTKELSDANHEIKIFPNPSSGKFKVSGFSENSPVKVYDANGKCIYKRKTVDDSCIDLSESRPGYYFLEAKDREKVIRKKIVVE